MKDRTWRKTASISLVSGITVMIYMFAILSSPLTLLLLFLVSGWVCYSLKVLIESYRYEEIKQEITEAEALRRAMVVNITIKGPY